MSIEMPNFFEAAGWFDGFDPPFNPNPIYSSNGVQPFNPATTEADPVGGFTRLNTAAYLIKLVRSIDVLEAIVMITCFPTIEKLGRLCGSVVPGDEGDGSVLVLGDLIGEDDVFQFGIFRFLSDLSGTQPIAGVPIP
jgi:hypothetical protein